MKKITIFNLAFVVSNLDVFADFVIDSVVDGKPKKILPTTMNEVSMAERSEKMKKKLDNFDFLTMDGMPLVFLARLKGFGEAKRIYGPELMERIYDQGQKKKIKHYLYGGSPEILEKLSMKLKEKYPSSLTVGKFAPPFRALSETEKKQIVQNIKKVKPDIVWVGLGSSKQVEWIDEFFPQLSSTCIGVGAAFDFLSGNKRQAPYFMRSIGFEWLFRLFSEPKRLWKRYLWDVPIFLASIVLNNFKGTSES